MAITNLSTTLTSAGNQGTAGDYSSAGTSTFQISYANIGYIPSTVDAYVNDFGAELRLFVNGTRIYRLSTDTVGNDVALTTAKKNRLDSLNTSFGNQPWTIDSTNSRIQINKDHTAWGDDHTDNCGYPALSAWTIVKVVRIKSDKTALTTDFQNASVLTEKQLDNAFLETFHIAQEAFDTTEAGALTKDTDDVWNAASSRIKNISTPIQDNDATNKAYVDGSSDVQTVAGLEDEVALLGTTAMATASTGHIPVVAGKVSEITTVAGDAVDIGKVAAIDANVTKVADIDANVTKVANIDANVTKVADIDDKVTSVAGKETEVGLLGVAGVIEDMGYLGTAGVVEDMGHLGTSANVTAMGNLGTSTNVTNMANLNASGVISNIGTVATNVANVNNFANTYFGAHANDTAVASHISTNSLTLGAGDLYYNTTSNSIESYNGSSWESMKTEVGGNTVTSAEGSNLILRTVDDHENVVINGESGTSGNTILLPKVRATTKDYVLAMTDITNGTTAWAETQVSPTLTSFTGTLNAYETPYSYTGTTNSTTTISSLSSTTGLTAGQYISGTGIPAGTTIASVNTGASTLVLSQAATAGASGVALSIQKTPGEKSGGTLVLTGTDFGVDTSEITVQIYAASSGGLGIAATYIRSLSSTSCTAEWTGNEGSYNGFSGNYWVEIKRSSLASARVSSGANMTGDPTVSNFTVSDATISSVAVAGQKATLGTYGGYTEGGGKDSNTKLLLNFDRAGGTDFEDSSNTGGDGHKVTASGGAIIKSSPFGDGKSAMYFDGALDCLVIADTPVLGAANFAIDFWINPSVTQNAGESTHYIWDGRHGSASNSSLQIIMTGSSQIYIAKQSGVSCIAASAATAISRGAWSHIAVVRESSDVIKLYINGVLKGTDSDSSGLGTFAIGGSDQNSTIGMEYSQTDSEFTGYIDEFRIVSGEAIFTADFTPSQYRYDNTGAVTGPNGSTHNADTASNTKLLIHSDQSHNDNDGKQLTYYTPPLQKTETTDRLSGGSHGHANWNSSAWYFGSTGALVFPAENSTDFHTGSGDWTLECWIRRDRQGEDEWLVAHSDGFSTSTPIGLHIDSSNNTLGGRWRDTENRNIYGTTALAINTWYHVMMCKIGTNIHVGVNGARENTEGSMSGTGLTSSVPFVIGRLVAGSTSEEFKGYLSDLRLTIGLGIYTGETYDVPTESLTKTWDAASGVAGNSDASKVRILMLGNSANSTTGFKDSSDGGHTVTPTGAAHSQGHGGIAPAMAFPASGKKIGSAGVYFDGNGDYITSTLVTALGTTSFTLDFWVYYQEGDDANSFLFDTRNSNSDGFYLLITKSTGLISFGMEDATDAATTTALPVNTWTHLAFQRSQTHTSCYFNGVREGHQTNTISGTDVGNLTNTAFRIGIGSALSGSEFKGYMDSVRLSYTANYGDATSFTVPTRSYGAFGPATTNIGTITLAGSATPTADVTFTEMASSLPSGLTLADSGSHGATIQGTLTAPDSNETISNIRIQAKAGTDDTRVTEIAESNQVGNLTLTNKATGAPVVFNARRYVGNDSVRDINFGFRPDMVWFKERSSGNYHQLFDSLRGGTKLIYPNSGGHGQATRSGTADGYITSFNSNGISITADTSDNGMNQTGEPMIAWAWKAGGVPSADGKTMTDGTESTISSSATFDGSADMYDTDLISEVRRSVNTAGGFSIVKWKNVTTASKPIPHGLGAIPDLVIITPLDAGDWFVTHSGLTSNSTLNNKSLVLNTNAAEGTAGGMGSASTAYHTYTTDNTAHDHNGTHAEGVIAYCWKSVTGVSKIDYYDGGWTATAGTTPIVNVGFIPRFFMVKRTNATGHWNIYDAFRSGATAHDEEIQPSIWGDEPDAEKATSAHKMKLYNSGGTIGFTPSEDDAETTANNARYIYVAFA